MTFHDTCEKIHDTASAVATDHVWEPESTHATSLGQVTYMRCAAGCGAWRVDTLSPSDGTHVILSREVKRSS